MASFKQSFGEFIFATNTDGSGKTASYIRALDMLGPILTKHYPKPIVGGSMWHGFSLADIHALHELICAEMKKGAASPVLADSDFVVLEAFKSCIFSKIPVKPLYGDILGHICDVKWCNVGEVANYMNESGNSKHK